MQMRRDRDNRRVSNGNHVADHHHHRHHGHRHRHSCGDLLDVYRDKTPPPHPPPRASSISFAAYIQHKVSKLDTLPGLAIKYGVEVVDIRKINGLVMDSQMFALKFLNIPLPARHPPSPCMSNASDSPGQSTEKTPNHHFLCRPNLKSPHRAISPAMSTLQGYYGLKPIVTTEGEDSRIQENGYHLNPFPSTSKPLNRHRKSRSLVNDFLDQKLESTQSRENDTDKLTRRRQKSEADFSKTPEILLTGENGIGGGFSVTKGKRLSLRNKGSNRITLASDSTEPVVQNTVLLGNNDDIATANGVSGFRKSLSTPSLQDQENNNGSSSSIWPTSTWGGLISDSQTISTLVIPRPGRKKTALD